ncbi:MAG TPA: phosphoribosyltransferase [Bryobacteraceae bacterium]|nr:phosphoribosyltransferase [Bryobacteraceae bacterium]
MNREDAGRQLAARLAEYEGDPRVLVLGLPRGGVPVAYEVARLLGAPLDVLVVRKLGVPGHRELAMGAIASGGGRFLNREVIDALRIPAASVQAVEDAELREIERQEQIFRGDAGPARFAGCKVIVVDDGLATGSTMRAAVRALRRCAPAQIIVAAPVGAAETVRSLREEADSVVCLSEPLEFQAVSMWYDDFSQTSDEEVHDLLEARRREEGAWATSAGTLGKPLNTRR